MISRYITRRTVSRSVHKMYILIAVHRFICYTRSYQDTYPEVMIDIDIGILKYDIISRYLEHSIDTDIDILKYDMASRYPGHSIGIDIDTSPKYRIIYQENSRYTMPNTSSSVARRSGKSGQSSRGPLVNFWPGP